MKEKTPIKRKKPNFFVKMFMDENDINEKSIVGFGAFIMMVLTLLVDVISGAMGNHLVINEFIFDGFMVITLGAFGIASVDKWINRKSSTPTNDTTTSDEEPPLQ